MRVMSVLQSCLLVVLATALTPVPATADETTPLSSRQMRALSAQRANRQARRDLLSILKGPGKIRRGMLVAVRSVVMTTPSYGTQFPGLCRSDQLWLDYAPVEDRPSEDVPVRPYGIVSTPVYRVAGIARARDPGRSRQETTWQPACADLTDDRWFSAPDDDVAYVGVLALHEAAAGLRAGKFSSISCAKADLPKGQDCKQAMLAVLTDADLSSIARCEPKEGRCYHYDIDDWSVTIFVTDGGKDSDVPGVEKIDLDGPMIVVT